MSKSNPEILPEYIDDDGNRYVLERAYNGNWIVIRYNEGGRRKKSPLFAPSKNVRHLISEMDKTAIRFGWTITIGR
jgi:hypothetical protein